MADEESPPPAGEKDNDFRWMLKLGLGGVLLATIVPWMMLTISQGFRAQEKNSVAMEKAADAMDDLADVVEESVTESRNLRTGLAPLMRELDRVAVAVRAQTKAAQETVAAIAEEAAESPADGP